MDKINSKTLKNYNSDVKPSGLNLSPVLGNAIIKDNEKLNLNPNQVIDKANENKNILLDVKELEKYKNNLNEILKSKDISVQYSMDEETGQSIVQFLDNSNNNEVIKQFPSEEMLKITKSIKNFIDNQSKKLDKYESKSNFLGLIINERV